MTDIDAEYEVQRSEIAESNTLAQLNKSEIDQQIATAHKFPRSIKRFHSECMDMVTLTEEIATECIYVLPRGGKKIRGPSARFAEIIASAWGNCRAGARTISEDREFVTSQGVFHDLERNVAINYEVKRRIVDSNGFRYKPDMVGVTANAACSIALRNAILKGIPKAFWKMMYDKAEQTARGDLKTLSKRRDEAIKYLAEMKVTKEQICNTLEVDGIEDIGLDELMTLRGIVTAIKDGDTTAELAFSDTVSDPDDVNDGTASAADIKKKVEKKTQQKTEKKPTQQAEQDTAPDITPESVFEEMRKANDMDDLDAALSLANDFEKADKEKAAALYEQCKNRLAA